jgi:peptidyl-prolyl cis-trans isomerase SurA
MFMRSAITLFVLFTAHVLWAGEVLDRIVANVNGNVVLQSDWDDEVRYECFMSDRNQQDLTAEDRKDVLDRLVDQELLREQMRGSDFESVSAGQVEKQLQDFKQGYSARHDGKSWNAGLSTYGVDESDVRNHITLELNQLRLVDARLRPSIQITETDIESYYREQVRPKFSASQPVSLQEVAPKIREILTQQQMNQLLSSWLETLRSQAQIQVFPSDSIGSQASKP